MSVFKEEPETKRVIFNVRMDLAQRLEQAKEDAKSIGKKLDLDGAVDKALEKFLKKAEKRIEEIQRKQKGLSISSQQHPNGEQGQPEPAVGGSSDG